MMTTTVDAPAYVPSLPMNSIVRRRVSDVRLGGGAGYALLLQVGHPTIASGVRDHSSYASEPWPRLFRTADYVFLLTYGEPQAVAAVARNLREMHRSIRGTGPDGRPYRALEPSAYAWVHATIGESIVRAHDLFGRTFADADRERFWAEWLLLGEILGVRDGDLPETWSGFQDYLAAMVNDVLVDSDVVQEVLSVARLPIGGSPFTWLPSPIFAAASIPLGRYLRFAGTGTTPPVLRARFGMRWTPAHQAAFVALAKASKAATPVMPKSLRQAGPLALRLRRTEMAAGPFSEAATLQAKEAAS